ncbi:MAG: xanthine dehydrogenase family protein molybdopterin-binding subunit [Candidatus Heimdallarchaeota archaeon]|nr:MAG: xanthine dehydrogenase family protein molybdopterin-binding subunit [Candidatus Heimdallarchaeota archaeon]
MTKYVGHSVPRKDAFEKVSGTAVYAFDIDNIPNMLYCKFLTSPHAHARIVSIDTSKAEKLSGVSTVITGKDWFVKIGLYAGDRDILAVEKVVWVGQPVVAVAAISEAIAAKALELVQIKYEVLSCILDPIEAKKSSEILVHEKMAEYEHSPAFNPVPGTNIANHFKLRKGDIEKGFSQADFVIENTYTMPQVAHAYLEPLVSIGHYRTDGTIEVWSSAQSPFTVRYLLSVTFGVPISNITVHAPFLGGGFGGKAGLNFEPLVVLLSRKAGNRPVKLRLTREENFRSAPIRVGMVANVKTGMKSNGRILAEELEYIWDSGACADYAVNVGRAGGYVSIGPYDIENIKSDSYTIYTNKPYATAFRGFGHMELHWAIERQRDAIAVSLKMDPVEFRKINTLKPGKSLTANQDRLREDAGNLDQCLEKVWNDLKDNLKDSPIEKPWFFRGIGIAGFMKGPAQPPNSAASAYVKFNEDGGIIVSVGTSEMGQGTITSLAQIAAEELGLPIEKVKIRGDRDTDRDAYTWQTVGSRSLFMDGNAVRRACEDARSQIFDIASQVLNIPSEDLTLKNELIYPKGERWKHLSLAEVVMGYMYPSGESIGGPVIGRGKYIAKMTMLDPETGAGKPAIFDTFGAQGAEIQINVLTGEVIVKRLVSAFDIGKAINPGLCEGQIIGGGVMALSIALNEQLQYNEKGELLNPNLVDYIISRSGDIPKEFVSHIVENPQEDGPYGARGIGELTMLGVPAAIGNAIFNAIDVCINDLPLTPQRIWSEIQQQRPELLMSLKKKILED